MTFQGSDNDAVTYWKGVRNTYHSLLVDSFPGWAERGTTGYYVFMEGMTYDAAVTAANIRSPHGWSTYRGDDPADTADAVAEDSYWKRKQAWSERPGHTDDEEH